MIVSYLSSKSTLSTFLVAGLALLTFLPTRAWANGIDEFVTPTSGYLSFQVIGGSAGGVTTFGLGTSPSDFVALFTGLPNNPSSTSALNVGFFSAGTTIFMGMFTTFNGQSGWAFSNGTDQASIIAFSDTLNSLGLGGSIFEKTGPNTWVLHLDDALSYQVDDDNNDVLIKMRITSKPISSVPEPTSGLLLLFGSSVVAGIALRVRKSLPSESR